MGVDIKKAGEIMLEKNKEGLKQVAAEILFPALDEAVLKSKTPIDDVALAALKPELVKQFNALIDKL